MYPSFNFLSNARKQKSVVVDIEGERQDAAVVVSTLYSCRYQQAKKLDMPVQSGLQVEKWKQAFWASFKP